ncbi:MAG TPA: YbaY family lipoprotein [Blastocatellia bacterium]|nr:YbaY family lipoprotein [Blastocatellia bacterium]
MDKPLVSGEILFAEQPHLPSDVKAYVRLSDVGMADAPSRLVAEEVLTDIAQKANSGKPIPFVLYGALQDQRGSYAISVLVDVDGNGKISSGDFINMQSYPVLTFGYPSHVAVQVKKVN